MNASFTNVIGLSSVLARVKDCWASLYGERVLAYQAEQHLAEEPAIAVIVQKMIFSDVSGVMFTADPMSGALDRMIIEPVFGQSEAIVSGRVEPDTYILDKAGPQLISVRQGMHKFIIAGAERRILLAASAPWRSATPTISPRHRLHGLHGRS